jgi:hypothetical protein
VRCPQIFKEIIKIIKETEMKGEKKEALSSTHIFSPF